MRRISPACFGPEPRPDKAKITMRFAEADIILLVDSAQQPMQAAPLALLRAYPDINMDEKHFYTFEALLIAADAFKRAGTTYPKALVDAIRTTNITDNISIGPGIQFNEKGQNDKLKNAAIQNRAGKFAIIAPKAQSNAKPELPMTPYDKRG
jgi:branched-chain amino acid transport system substrate-binding protein